MSNASVKFFDDVDGSPLVAILREGQIVEAAELSLPELLMLAGQVLFALHRRGHLGQAVLGDLSMAAAKVRMH